MTPIATRILTLELPVCPTQNHYWGQRGHRKFLTAEALAYRDAVLARYTEHTRGITVAFPAGDIGVLVGWHRAIKRGDIDNRRKALYDALNGLAWTDDKQISRDGMYRLDGPRDRAKMLVHICQPAELLHLEIPLLEAA